MVVATDSVVSSSSTGTGVGGIAFCLSRWQYETHYTCAILLGTNVAILYQFLGESLTHILVDDCMMVVAHTQAI